MPRYIDADAAIEAIKRPHGGCYTEEAKAFAVYQVLSVPTADVRENVHAHWTHERLVSTGGGSYTVVRCSACQWQFPMSETRFCPNCGARMDERREE